MKLEDIVYAPSSTRTVPNKMMKENVAPFLRRHNVETVLDYGCGRFLRDSVYLTKRGFKVDAVDLEEQVKIIDKSKSKLINSLGTEIRDNNYDAALLNFILQVIPREEKRDEILKNVCSAVKEGGFLIVSLRNQWDINNYVKPNGMKFNDGYVLSRTKTFVRGYSLKEMKELLASASLTLLELHYSRVSYVSISQK